MVWILSCFPCKCAHREHFSSYLAAFVCTFANVFDGSLESDATYIYSILVHVVQEWQGGAVVGQSGHMLQKP